MKISLTDAGKRFNRDWIFRHFTYLFEEGKSYAITGPNGSGKSTLLQVLAGAIDINEGGIQWSTDMGPYPTEKVYEHISICAPYLEVVEEMTAAEFLSFHQHFKPLLNGFDTNSIISAVGLETAKHKQIRYYSSGMKQRIKLAQAVFSDTPVVLLDEPCTNLDTTGISLYHQLISDHCRNRLVIVSSNDEVEYSFCENLVNITRWK